MHLITKKCAKMTGDVNFFMNGIPGITTPTVTPPPNYQNPSVGNPNPFNGTGSNENDFVGFDFDGDDSSNVETPRGASLFSANSTSTPSGSTTATPSPTAPNPEPPPAPSPTAPVVSKTYYKNGKVKSKTILNVDGSSTVTRYDKNGKITSRSYYSKKLKKPITINRKIENSKQGKIGDCWLLGGLNSFSYKKKGAKAIKNAIKINKNGTYTVKLKGVGKKYTISNKDLEKARQKNKYSTGDSDMLLMELAVEKFRGQIRKGKKGQQGGIKPKKSWPKYAYNTNTGKGSSLEGGNLRQIAYLLTGKKNGECQNGSNNYVSSKSAKKFSKMLKKLEKNPKKYVMDVNFWGQNENSGSINAKNSNNKDIKLHKQHEYSVKSVKGGKVTLVNPWDSSKDIVLTKKEFLKYANWMTYHKFGKK